MNRSAIKWLTRLLLISVLGFLLWWVVHNAPLGEIWAAFRGLRLWEIAVLLAANTFLYILVTLRWWIIARADARHIPFLPLLGARVSVFAVSYFTLGPQVGGEPLQVLFLQRKYGLTYTRATASVLMDKILEFLIDFILLAIGLTAIFRAGALTETNSVFSWELIGLILLMLWPPAHLVLLYHRKYPLTALVRAIPFIPKNAKATRFLRAAEWLAGNFCRLHLPNLLAALGVSLLAGGGMVAEYALMASFLGIHLPFWKTVAAWAAGWLAFLMPLPGGLGALEASQVFVLGGFGIRNAAAISLILLMRGRDLLIGGLGLLMAGTASWTKKSKAS
ncbi:MAG TPA: lysylphosphatidylglycerol synthase transmembrane domain-containing protein [Anaerolineales bacterium]